MLKDQALRIKEWRSGIPGFRRWGLGVGDWGLGLGLGLGFIPGAGASALVVEDAHAEGACRARVLLLLRGTRGEDTPQPRLQQPRVLHHVVARPDDQPAHAAVRSEAHLQRRQRLELPVVQRSAVLGAHLG